MKNSNSDVIRQKNPKKTVKLPLEIILLAVIALFCLYMILTGNSIESLKKTGHYHTPLHGGMVVCVGMHNAHLELLHQPDTGIFTIYILDDLGENYYFLDIDELSIQIRNLNSDLWINTPLPAVKDEELGSRPGRSCKFSGKVPDLISQKQFEVKIQELVLFGTRYPSFTIRYH